MKRRWTLFAFALALPVILVATAVYVGRQMEPGRGNDPERPGAGGHEDVRQETASADGIQPDQPEQPQNGGPARHPINEPPVERRLTSNWSAGQLSIVPESLTFEIARDYNQRAVIGLRNDSEEDLDVTARLGPCGGGLLAGFVGLGSEERPFTIASGERVELSLYLFAQDAERPAYHTQLVVHDAGSGERLAAAALRVLVPVPEFDVEAMVGEPQPGALALPVTLENRGQTLTDVTVRAGEGLRDRVSLQPAVEHAYLRSGQSLEFSVLPHLAAGFTQLEGEITVRAAGQDKTVPLRFELPEGMQVFVASSFSTESRDGASWYCTNRPNVDSFLGGFVEGPIPPSSPENPYLQQGQWAWQWGAIGPFRFRTIWGDAPGMAPLSPRYRSGKIPLGISQPDVEAPPEERDEKPPGGETNLPGDGSSSSPDGGTSGLPANSEVPRADDPQIVYMIRGGTHHGPRGRRVRHVYALYRPHIYQDNGPEAMLSYGRGAPADRDILQVWHTNRHEGAGRQIVFRAWDGFALHPLTGKQAIGRPQQFGQWPAVLALPDRRALVVWEQAPDADGPPSLVYRVSAPGYESWSDVVPVPGARADAATGHYDPVAVLTPEARVLLVWQRGDGPAARIMIARSNDEGLFDEGAAASDLPAGARRPIPQMSDDGTLYLAFQAPAGDGADDGKGATAVFVAASRDGGRSFPAVQQVSAKAADAGEPDLLVHDGRVHVAYRRGGAWSSRIVHASRGEDDSQWTQPVAISPEDMYAEFPSLLPLVDGVRVEFYGDRRELVTGAHRADDGPPAKTMIKRHRTTLRDGTWSGPQRLLTRFPTLRAAWLQVNFRLRTNRTKYRPHTVRVLLNGEELFAQEEIVPEGTFLLPIDPSLLRPEGRGTPPNVVGLRTEHMNQASYSNATGFRLQARHAFLERLVVARSQEEANRLMAAESGTVNHHRHDVGLFASLPLEPLPAAPERGEAVSVPLLLGNLGETAADGVRIEVFDQPPASDGAPRGNRVGEAIDVGTLEPMQQFRRLDVTFPYGGQQAYYIVTGAEGEDFDLANNVHVVSFAAPQPDPLPPRTYADSERFVVMLTDDPAPPYRIRLLDVAGNEVAVAHNGQVEGELPADEYRLAVQRFQFEGQEVVFPGPREYRPGEPLRVDLRTAVEVELPEEDEGMWRWELVSAADPRQIVQWHFSRHRVMHVPPGEYRVAIRPTQFNSSRLVWPQVISLNQDEHVVLRLDSGVRLQLPAEADDVWSWGLVPFHQPEESVQRFTNSPAERAAERRVMLVPPGEYRVAFQPTHFNSRRIVWPVTVSVERGRMATARLDSLLRLELPEQAGDIYSWAVARADHPDEPVQRFTNGPAERAAERRVMLIPPGEYRVAFQPTRFNSRRVVWPETVSLERGQSATARLDSLLRLELPEQAGDIYSWAVARADHPDEPVQRFTNGPAERAAERRVMLVPPGEYRVALRPARFRGQRLLWPEEFTVAAGTLARAALTSGILLIGDAEAEREVDVRILSGDEVVQSARRSSAVHVVPPGMYRVEVRPAGADGWTVLAEETEIEPGKVTELEYPRDVSD